MAPNEQFGEALKRACGGNRLRWYTVGELLHREMGKTGSAGRIAAIKAEAAAASDQTLHMITRYVGVYARLKYISEQSGRPLDALLSPIFSAIEVATRLYEYDRQRGIQALSRLHDRDMTLVEVRDWLETAKQASPPALRRSGSWSRLKEAANSPIERTREEEAAKHALAKAFCDLATKRGENAHPELVNELSLYGTEEALNGLIADVDEMTDLQSYVKARVPVPSLG